MGAVYRNQWSSIAASFTTFGVAFDMPIGQRYGGGAYFTNADEANVINTSMFVVSGSYLVTNPNQNKYYISTGLQLGGIYKRNNLNNLVFNNQYDGSNFDSDLPTGENFQQLTRFMPEVAFGVAYHNVNRAKKVRPYAEASLFHITMPNEAFVSEEKHRLPMRWLGFAGAQIEANRELIIDPQVFFQMQRASMEITAGSMVTYELQGTDFHVLGGAFYRVGDAAILQAGIKHGFNVFRISYDFNTSPLKEFSNMRGALEFTVAYQPGRRRTRAIY